MDAEPRGLAQALSTSALPRMMRRTRRRTGGITSAEAVAVAVVATAVATLPTLGRQPLSWNEAVTSTAAQRSLPNLAGLLSHTDLPLGAYYLLMHGWLDTLGLIGIRPTEGWLRLPSALAAIGAAAVLAILVARWFDPRTAAMAGGLFAVHPLLTFYAQDARPYALVTFTFLLSTWALMRALNRPSAPRRAGYAGLATLTMYVHLLAVYGLLAHAVLLLRGAPRRRWLVTVSAVALACTPLAVLGHGQRAELNWIPRPSLGQTLSVVGRLAGGPAFVVVALALVATALVRRRVPTDRLTMFLAAWALVPPAALVIGNLFSPQLVARYGLISVAAVAIILALAGARVGGRLGAGLLVAVLLTAATTTVVQQARPYKYEDYRAATDTMADIARPGDAVLFWPVATREGYDAYARMEPELRLIRDIALADGGQPSQTDEIGGIDRPTAQVGRLLAGVSTVFLLGNGAGAGSATNGGALRRFHVQRIYRWGDLSLTVLRRDG